jgi:hypothetical protein
VDIIKKVSSSIDEVSTALAPIFTRALYHTEEILTKAKHRKELGRPPRKSADPLGDQVTWEQILSRCVGIKKLWIISRDSDYGVFYNNDGFLNQFLYDELRTVSPDAKAFFFEEVVK